MNFPSFLNVLRGQIDVSGRPRRSSRAELERYGDQMDTVLLAVRPGLSGPRQVFPRS